MLSEELPLVPVEHTTATTHPCHHLMRILMLAQFYPPIIGGEERHVRNLSASLAERGHDVAVATIWHKGLPEYERDGDVRVYRIRSIVQRAPWLFREDDRHHAPPFPDPELALALRRIIARQRPNIVHAHNWMVHSFVPLKRWSASPLVMTLHDYSLRCAKKRYMYHGAACSGPGLAKCLYCASDHYGPVKGTPTAIANWVMGTAERAAVDIFVPVSRAVAVASGLTGSDLPFEIIPNFVPDDVASTRGDPHPVVAELPSGGFLLFVGDVGREKGVDVLLQAYGALRNPPPLILLGRRLPDTPQHLPRNVKLLENVPHDVVMRAWRLSSIGIVPSVWPDPCPTVAMEAMAAGSPVVASNVGGLPDLVLDGETGVLVPPGDVPALQRALASLLEDHELRARMGDAARRRILQFQAAAVVPRIERVYEEVTRSGGGSNERVRPHAQAPV